MTMSTNTPNVDKLIEQIQCFNIVGLGPDWFKNKTRLQLEKKLKALAKEKKETERQVSQAERDSKRSRIPKPMPF